MAACVWYTTRCGGGRSVHKRWFERAHYALQKHGVNPWGEQVALTTGQWMTIAASLVFVCVPLNALLLPACALFPPTRQYIFSKLRSLGDEGEVHGVRRETGYCDPLKIWWEDVVLIEIPFFKAWIRHLSNIAFAAVLLTSAGPVGFRLAWAASFFLSCAIRLLFDYSSVFIAWDAWMLLAASGLLCTGLALEAFGQDNVEVWVRQGILALGQLLLNLDTMGGIFLQSIFFGPMVLSISQMLSDMIQWSVIFLAVVGIFKNEADLLRSKV